MMVLEARYSRQLLESQEYSHRGGEPLYAKPLSHKYESLDGHDEHDSVLDSGHMFSFFAS